MCQKLFGTVAFAVILILNRGCKCSPYPCEKHECACGGSADNPGKLYPACSKCLAMCLWQGSNDAMKKVGR
jgi:hypothetical protein